MAWRVKPTDTRYKQMTAYLEQEVDSTDNAFAFVDLNGTGYTMNCVGEVIYKKTGLKMRSFYYTFWGAKTYPYCECLHYSNGDGNLCEVLCRAPHGCTEGYYIKDGKVIPQLSAFPDSEFEHCGMSEYLEGIKLYAKTLADATVQMPFIHTGAKHISEDILKYLQEPEISIVEFLGNALGQDYEVVLHDLDSDPPAIAAITNGTNSSKVASSILKRGARTVSFL